jgi:hypothetical protein
MRRCKQCRIEIPPAAKCTDFISKKGFCGIDCAAAWGQKAVITKREREYRKSSAEARDRLKTRSDWIKEAQAAFNAYVRERDAGRPCVSCGNSTGAKMNAGHYRTTKAAPNLRFNLKNCHIQCEHCNSWLSGNLISYRQALLSRFGSQYVEWLESQNETRRYDVDYLKRLKAVFIKRKKHLERVRLCKTQSN